MIGCRGTLQLADSNGCFRFMWSIRHWNSVFAESTKTGSSLLKQRILTQLETVSLWAECNELLYQNIRFSKSLITIQMKTSIWRQRVVCYYWVWRCNTSSYGLKKFGNFRKINFVKKTIYLACNDAKKLLFKLFNFNIQFLMKKPQLYDWNTVDAAFKMRRTLASQWIQTVDLVLEVGAWCIFVFLGTVQDVWNETGKLLGCTKLYTYIYIFYISNLAIYVISYIGSRWS